MRSRFPDQSIRPRSYCFLTYIEHLPWERVEEEYGRPHTLHYLDLPYWGTEGYGVDFGFEQYDLMNQLATQAHGSVIISINDHPDIRRVFAGLHMKEVAITYTVGGGSGSNAKELIIWNANCEAGRLETGTLSLF